MEETPKTPSIQKFCQILADAAKRTGGELIPMPLEQYRAEVQAQRDEDRRMLAAGEITPEELQRKNSFCGDNIKIKVLDYSPAYR